MPPLLNRNAKGVYIISATPFTEDGAIDWDSVGSLVDFYLTSGVSGITILGMLGEAHKLSDTETADYARRYIAEARGRVPVVVGASNPNPENVLRLGRIAMDVGASGVMIAPAGGLKTDDQIVAYFKSLADGFGANVPLVYQDYPFSTGVIITAEGFVRLLDACPSVVMLKHEDWPGLRKLSDVRRLSVADSRPRIGILCGNGGLYLPQELRRGADGAMTGFAYPEMLVGVVALALDNRFDQAEDLFDIYLPLVRHEQQPGIGLAIRKEILRRRGAIRYANLRAPGPKLDAEDLREIDSLMARLEQRLATAPVRAMVQ